MHDWWNELKEVRQANVMACLKAALASLSMIWRSTDNPFAAKRVMMVLYAVS